jgi:hypothetical protein
MKKIFKILSGLLFIYLVVFSCSKDNSPSVSISPGNIKSDVDAASINFSIRNVTRQIIWDTVSIKLTGYSPDSSAKIVISFYKVVGFKPQTFKCGSDLYSGTIVSVGYFANGEHYECDGIFGDGNITVYSYNTDAISGKFSLNAGKLYDTTKTVKLTGEFNAVFDINSLIKDIDIPQGQMQAKVNDNIINFDVIAAKVSFNGVDSTLIVTGIHNNESIELLFNNLMPTSGQVFVINRSPILDTGFIMGSYTLDSLSTFVTSGHDSATFARFSIVKISSTYIQGKFEFVGEKVIAPYNLVNITEGKFNSKINHAYSK